MAASVEYSQVYVIYGFYMQICIPCIYFLMRTKSQSEYERYISRVSSLVFIESEIHSNWFKKAPIYVFQIIFPKKHVYFCLTYYSNSIYKMLMKHTLANKYSCDRKFDQIVNILKSIVFVDHKKYIWKFVRLSMK
jgi:hypothetical protein